MAKGIDPLKALIEHHPILMMGAGIIFGTFLGKAIGELGVDVITMVKGNDRGEYGKKA